MRTLRLVAAALLSAAMLSGVLAPNAAAEPSRSVIFVVDTSGSMGGTPLTQAKEALLQSVDALDPDIAAGLRTYSSCTGTGGTLLVPVGTDNRSELRDAASALSASGGTGTGEALRAAVNDLPPEGQRTVVLISDGQSNCGEPPCLVANDLRDSGVDITVHAVGFNAPTNAESELRCVADATGGDYFSATDAAGLASAIGQAIGVSDRDRDGLPDFWEESGYRAEAGLILVDLPALGADPDRKDIFVLIDWENGTYPSPSEQAIVVDAFAEQGISLHLIRGFELSASESDALKTMTSDGKVQPDYEKIYQRMPIGWSAVGHFGVSVKWSNWKPSGQALLPGQLFVLNYCENGRNLPICVGSTNDHAGTLMHEIGHNLGLKHGGDENTQFKPNYFSVMNYAYDSGIPGLGVTYSDWGEETLNVLDEKSLAEADGVYVKAGAAFPRKVKARFYCPDEDLSWFGWRKNAAGRKQQVDVGQSADWNCDGTIQTDRVEADINWPKRYRDDPTYNDGLRLLRPHDDWQFLHDNLGTLERGGIGKQAHVWTPGNPIA